MSLRRWMGMVAVVVGGLWLLGGSGWAELKRLRVAHSQVDALAPMVLFLAKERGYFADEGIEPVFLQAKTVVAIAALLSGELHFTMAAPEATRAALQGARVKVLYAVSNRSLFWLHARPQIKGFRELKGKTIGVSALGSGPHVAVAALLRANGLDPERDVRYVAMGLGRERLLALKAGSIDANTTTTSSFSPSQQAGFTLLGYAGLTKEVGAGLVSTDRLIQEQPREVKGVVKAMVKGIKRFLAKREEAIAHMSKITGADREDSRILYDEISQRLDGTGVVDEGAMLGTIESARQVMKLKKAVSLEEVLDSRFAKEANQELSQAGWRP